MVRQGYIYQLINGKICNRCPIVYTNSEYIYFAYNGDKMLHYVNQHSSCLLSVEEYYKTQEESPNTFNYSTFYVAVSNHEKLNYDGELAECCVEIQRLQNLRKRTARDIDGNKQRIEQYLEDNKKSYHQLTELDEALEKLNEQKAQILAKRKAQGNG